MDKGTQKQEELIAPSAIKATTSVGKEYTKKVKTVFCEIQSASKI